MFIGAASLRERSPHHPKKTADNQSGHLVTRDSIVESIRADGRGFIHLIRDPFVLGRVAAASQFFPVIRSSSSSAALIRLSISSPLSLPNAMASTVSISSPIPGSPCMGAELLS